MDLEEYERKRGEVVKEACDWQDVLIKHASVPGQLETNQKAIDLLYEYFGDDDFYDPKELLKYLWNRGFYIQRMIKE